MEKDNLNKKGKKVVGFISSHQWGIVLDRGGCSATQVSVQHKMPIIVVKQWKRKS